jgi:electron transfer flavoprotein alpha subunit
MSRKVLVIGEMREGELRNISFECVAAARRIAGEGEVVGALFGKNAEQRAGQMIYYGADRVLVSEEGNLQKYTSDAYRQAVIQICESENPESIILGHTSMGKDLAPQVAAELQSGLISDVVDLEVEGGNVVFTRPIYSGKAFEKREIEEGLIFGTVRPNNIPSLEKDESKNGEINSVDLSIKDLRTIIKDTVKKSTGGIDLSEANVIVAGGRGVKSEEGFNTLYELADVLGAGVGASRGACDAEYCDYSLQIGQTGKVVTPELYIAVGLSGAIQHLAGMSNSKVIVAINKDPEAPIFEVADYGIVGDLFEVVPLLKDIFKEELYSNA